MKRSNGDTVAVLRLRVIVFSTVLLGTGVWAQTSGQSSAPVHNAVLSAKPAVNQQLPNAPSYSPLAPKEKFSYFWHEARNPLTFASAGITAATWHLRGDPPYGGGMAGFGESYAAALGQREMSMFLGRYLIPVALHQDPRYFAAPAGKPVLYRAAYAASRVLLTRSDAGNQTWNGSYILGGIASSTIAAAYIRDRDFGSVMQDFAVGMGTDAGMNIVREFWPSLRFWLPGKKTKKLGDMVIGKRGIPNYPTEPKQK